MVLRFGSLCLLVAVGCVQAQLIQFSSGEANFKLADRSIAPDIIVASDEEIGVSRAAKDVAWDFGRVVGVSASPLNSAMI